MANAKRTKENLKSSNGRKIKEAAPARNAGVYKISIPVLLDTCAFFLSEFWDEPIFQNLEYCIFFPLISENPAFPRDAKLITDIADTNKDGGGGYIKLSNEANSIVRLISFLFSAKIGRLV